MLNSVMILWIYIVLLLAGGIVGFVKGKSKASLIASSIFAVLIGLCATNIIPIAYATWLMSTLILVFGIRLMKTKKFMPSGLMIILTIVALVLTVSRFHLSQVLTNFFGKLASYLAVASADSGGAADGESHRPCGADWVWQNNASSPDVVGCWCWWRSSNNHPPTSTRCCPHGGCTGGVGAILSFRRRSGIPSPV